MKNKQSQDELRKDFNKEFGFVAYVESKTKIANGHIVKWANKAITQAVEEERERLHNDYKILVETLIDQLVKTKKDE